MKVDRERIDRIASRCGLDGLGIESRCRWGFPQTSGPALGPTLLPIQWARYPYYRG